MKKSIILFTVLSVTCTAVSAQVKWSVNAGIVSANNYESDKLAGGRSYTGRQGFTVGGIAGLRLFKNISSETGLSFYQKGYRYRSAPMPDYTANVLFRLNYITLNQNILVNIKGKNGLSFSTGLGAFVATPFSGRYVSDNITIIGFTHEEGNLKFGNSEWHHFKRLDAGLNVLVRSQYKNIHLTMQYSPSFVSHAPGSDNNGGYTEKLRSISFILGYEF
jgi:hypothetical protein